MLFFFRGKNGPLVRALIGALLAAIGLAHHGGLILVAIGVVLLVWGGSGAFAAYRTTARRRQIGHGGPVS